MKKEYLLALITVLLWGSLAPTSKLVLASMNQMSLLFYNSLMASIVLLFVNFKKRGFSFLKKYQIKDLIKICALGFMGVFLYYVFYYYGLSKLSSQIACIVNYMWPSMIVLFSCLIMKEKLSISKICALICALSGVCLISLQEGFGNLDFSSILGILSCLMGAIVYGIYSVLNKKYAYDQYVVQFIVFLVSG